MASPDENQQSCSNSDLINCSICFEVFKRPKYLPCLHTFCETCLTTYIVSSALPKEAPTGFKCPVCRLDVKTPSASGDPKEWSKHFPINHLIMTLMDQWRLKTEKLECQPCKTRNMKSIASSWCVDCNMPICQNCGDYHFSMPALELHSIVPLDQPRAQPSMISTAHEVCDTHAGKKLEMFCKDHDTPCCVTCTMVDHRKCDDVITIQDATKDAKIHGNTQLKASLTQLLHDLDDLFMKKKSNLADIQNDGKCFHEKMKGFREEIEQNLDYAQAKLSGEIDKLHSECGNTLQDEADTIWNKKQVIENCLRVFQASYDGGSDIQFYLETKKLTKIHKQMGNFLQQEKQRHKDKKYRLNLNKEMKEITKLEMGCVVPNEQKLDESKSSSMETTATVPKDKAITTVHIPYDGEKNIHTALAIEFEIEKDYDICNISSCVWLPSQQSILLVNNNETQQAVCIYNLKGELIDQVSMEGKPFAAALVNKSCVALTIPEMMYIVFFNTQTVAREGNKISTPDKCYGICQFMDKIYTTCGNRILGYEKNGNLVHTVSTSHNMLFHLRITQEGLIYCADGSRVYMLDMKGQQMSQYHIGMPRIAVDNNGTLFVFSPCNSEIHVVSSKGVQQRTFFSKIRSVPKAMCFLGDNVGTFCVVSGSKSLEYKVKIYQFIF